MSLKGNFSGESRNSFSAARRAFIFRDSTDTLLKSISQLRCHPLFGFFIIAADGRREIPRRVGGIFQRYRFDLPSASFCAGPRITELARQTTKKRPTPFDKAPGD